MLLRNCLLLISFAVPVMTAAGQPVFDVMTHGATGDGKTLDTAAIQKAIDACHRSGGGVVYLPNGEFLSGTIELKSNVVLRLSPGATLRGSPRMEDYARPHLIYARGAENVAIDGGGLINGSGDAFWDANFRPKGRRPSPCIELVESRDIRIENIRIRNTPGWGIHPLVCDRVVIRGISIINDYRGPNTDGIDPDSTRNLMISDSYIETGDDAIVIKTSGRLGQPAPPSENITINNCVLMSDDAALKLGTESHGDFRHISVSNCVIRKSAEGVAIYGKDGGVIEDVNFSRLSIETSSYEKRRTFPIYIDLDRRNGNSRQSRIRDITFSDIVLDTKGRILLSGMPGHPLENLTFRNIAVRITGFESLDRAGRPSGSATTRAGARGPNLGPIPAMFIASHVKGLNLDGIRVRWDVTDERPERHALYLLQTQDVTIRGFDGRQAADHGKLAAIALDGTSNIFISDSKAEQGTAVFVGLGEGLETDVVLRGNDLRYSEKETSAGGSNVGLRQ
jgi:hypothetical protein